MKSPPLVRMKVWGVAYVILAHFDLLDSAETHQKHFEMLKRRATKGQYFHHPYFGCREFQADFEWIDGAIPESPLDGQKDLGFMSHDLGRKFTVPYGLYRIHGYINPHLAVQTGFDENGQDLDLFWTALTQMFENDRSAARGEMSPQALIVFRHETALGNAPANRSEERRVGKECA